MRRLIVSEWITLDGVFDAESMGEWFQPYDSKPRQEYITKNVQDSGALLLGRTTYEMLGGYWSTKKNNEDGIADKMNSEPKYVVSTSLAKTTWNNSTIIKADVERSIRELKQQSGQDILVFGSAALVRSLMPTDLIDEYRFLVHPIVAGKGKRFFSDDMPQTKLKLASTTTIGEGVNLICYQRG